MFPSLSLLLAVLFAASATAPTATAQQQGSGSYWVQYGGDAPETCVVPDGESVPDSCCTGGDPFYVESVSTSTCFVISGLLGEDGGSLQSYLGCGGTGTDDAGEPVYGEGCYNNGENGGLIPPGEIVADYDASSIDECGCTFKVTGDGCHKIRDFSVLPGFENDARQVFIYLNETCNGGSGGGDSGNSSSSSAASRSGNKLGVLMGRATVLIPLVAFAASCV